MISSLIGAFLLAEMQENDIIIRWLDLAVEHAKFLLHRHIFYYRKLHRNVIMNDLVFIDNKEVYTDSLKVAEVFNKKHHNVLRDIRKILLHCNEFNALKFELVEFKDKKGESRNKYLLCKDALLLLVMGYGGEKALNIKLRYISEFNRMKSFIEDQFSIHNQLLETIKKDEISFSNGSNAGKALQKRKIEKPILENRIIELNSMLQVDWLKDLRIK